MEEFADIRAASNVDSSAAAAADGGSAESVSAVKGTSGAPPPRASLMAEAATETWGELPLPPLRLSLAVGEWASGRLCNLAALRCRTMALNGIVIRGRLDREVALPRERLLQLPTSVSDRTGILGWGAVQSLSGELVPASGTDGSGEVRLRRSWLCSSRLGSSAAWWAQASAADDVQSAAGSAAAGPRARHFGDATSSALCKKKGALGSPGDATSGA
mmetsp:Transcript_36695/g.117975  ORF Transcript_36695/g.117975 Transcript_36695/m.117975 type:complete len:217 (-) Transcript_36695:657-1307(-)